MGLPTHAMEQGPALIRQIFQTSSGKSVLREKTCARAAFLAASRGLVRLGGNPRCRLGNGFGLLLPRFPRPVPGRATPAPTQGFRLWRELANELFFQRAFARARFPPKRGQPWASNPGRRWRPNRHLPLPTPSKTNPPTPQTSRTAPRCSPWTIPVRRAAPWSPASGCPGFRPGPRPSSCSARPTRAAHRGP